MLRMHRVRLEEAKCANIMRLEKHATLERCKTSARSQLRRHHAAVRVVRLRVGMGALYSEDGEPIHTSQAVCASLGGNWSLLLNFAT